jgi:hypothetical protein
LTICSIKLTECCLRLTECDHDVDGASTLCNLYTHMFILYWNDALLASLSTLSFFLSFMQPKLSIVRHVCKHATRIHFCINSLKLKLDIIITLPRIFCLKGGSRYKATHPTPIV